MTCSPEEVLQSTVEETQQQAEVAFSQVARLERNFWQMAFNA